MHVVFRERKFEKFIVFLLAPTGVHGGEEALLVVTIALISLRLAKSVGSSTPVTIFTLIVRLLIPLPVSSLKRRLR